MRIRYVAQPFDNLGLPLQFSMSLIAYNTAEEIRGTSNDVAIIAKRLRPEHKDVAEPVRIRFVDSLIDDKTQKVARDYPGVIAKLGLTSFFDARFGYGRAVSKVLREENPDIAHVMNFWPICRSVHSARERHRLVLEMQSEWLSQMDRRKVMHQLEVVDAVLCVSDHISRLFRDVFPDYRGVVATAYNGVNTDLFKPLNDRSLATNEKKVIFVGRISPEKGVHTLIEAFSEVVREAPSATLELIGQRIALPERYLVGLSTDPLVKNLSRFYNADGTDSYQQQLDRLVSDLGLQRNVVFAGAIPHEKLISKLQSAQVLANPSLSESFGISIVEAMACGIPVVGSRVGGMQETIIDRSTGYLVEPENPPALAAAIISLLHRTEEASAMARAARERVVNAFSWKARADRISKVYQQVLG